MGLMLMSVVERCPLYGKMLSLVIQYVGTKIFIYCLEVSVV